ncbi:MAG TPA: ABC transporter substrate-binding protein [Patescibacteria group bacterium]|nr:ABC transporter substrate-binding protein [Patescibacteria group bacterium]
MPLRSSRSLLAILAAVLVAACSPAATAGPSAAPASVAPSSGAASPVTSSAIPTGPQAATTKLTVGLGYIPSVQFAQFYRADQAGYYTAEGLEVTFQNEIDANLVPKLGAGAVDLGLSDGTSVIPAVSQGIPIRYLATIYGQFPSVVFAKASSGITDADGLVGKKLGIPGKYGSSWIMLQALMASKGHTVADLTVVEYPDYGQGAAVTQGAVDAATGFVNNEPVQLELTGEKANVLRIDDVTPLPGPGIVAGSATLAAKRDAVAGFIRATFKAMNEIVLDPAVGLDAAIEAVPELGKERAKQAAILDATIRAWHPAGVAAGAPVTGAVDPAAWDRTVEFMTSLKLVPNPVTSGDLVDTSFAPGS